MKPHIVAAFDFDGTVTYGDTLFRFLWFTHSAGRFAWNMLCVSPALVAAAFTSNRRKIGKERIITQFFGGLPIEEVRELGETFGTQYIPHFVRPEALARIRWHQAKGHTCVLISASWDIYLTPWGKLVGLEVLGSRAETDGEGRITGRLLGENCRGNEKVRRLEELVGPRSQYRLYAYGDSDGDEALLAAADYAFFRQMPKEAPG